MAQAALKRAGKVRIVGASAGWPPVRDSGDRGIVLDHNNPPPDILWHSPGRHLSLSKVNSNSGVSLIINWNVI